MASSLRENLLAVTLLPQRDLPHASEADKLRAALEQALAARDALSVELADVLEQNRLILRFLRNKGFSSADAASGFLPAASPASYSADLLQRRRAIAAASGSDPAATLVSSSKREGALTRGAPAAGSGEISQAAAPSVGSTVEGDIRNLQDSINLGLERLRELRWRELVLQADISDFTGASPNSKALYESLGRLATSLPEDHPVVAKCMALGGVVEEMAATRGELALASERLSFLRGKQRAASRRPIKSPVPAHELWSNMVELSTAAPSAARAAAREHLRAATAGGAAPSSSSSSPSRSPSPLPEGGSGAAAGGGGDSPGKLLLKKMSLLRPSSPTGTSLPPGGRFNVESTYRDRVRRPSPRPFSPPRSTMPSIGAAARVEAFASPAPTSAAGALSSPPRQSAESQWQRFVQQFNK